MAELTTLARPYAQAVFRLAQEQQTLPRWSGMLALAAHIAADPGVRRLLDNPRMTSAQLSELFVDIRGDRLDEAGRNLIRVLAEARRLTVLPEIFGLFEQLKNAAEGAIQAQLITAF